MRPDIVSQTDTTFWIIVGISFFFLLVIAILMVYFVFKYSRKGNPNPSNITGNTKLEVIWTVVPTILVLGMFVSGYVGFRNMRNAPENSFNIKVIGRMWVWSFEYENGKKSDTLFVPLSKPIKMAITSNDVNHSFYLPSFRVKEDAIPGRTNYLWFQPRSIGSYNIECAEYCGLNHSYMYAKLVVMPDGDFEKWYTAPLPMDTTSAQKTDTTKVK